MLLLPQAVCECVCSFLTVRRVRRRVRRDPDRHDLFAFPPFGLGDGLGNRLEVFAGKASGFEERRDDVGGDLVRRRVLSLLGRGGKDEDDEP